MNYLIMALSGALAAFLANRGIAVFNDAVRPIMPEYREGRMTRAELATTTFALSFGLVIGFGIPFSIMSPIILVHSLFLGTDIIGIAFPGKPIDTWYKDRQSVIGAALSVVCGAAYGVLLLLGLKSFVDLMKLLPVNVFDAWGGLGAPVLYAFAVFPCVVIAMEYGWKKGLISLAIVLVIRQVVDKLKPGSMADGFALLAGLILVFFFAFRDKTPSTKTNMASVFSDRAKNIMKNLPYIACIGALYALACNMKILMEGPQSLIALKDGQMASAISITIARAISFVPLIGLTSLATGTFCVSGFGFTATAGLLASGPILAIVLGAVVMSAEALSLVYIAKLFDLFPGVRRVADSMRTAMTKLLEVALLVGSMSAANAMAPGIGFFVVAGLYLINEYFKRPMVRMVVGPLAAIIVGILVNVFAAVGLFTVVK